jgi:thiamine-monophosphate kinase
LHTETEIIERIWSRLPTHSVAKRAPWLQLGVGDDAAIVSGGPQGHRSRALDWVLSTDAFLEGVHFLPEVQPPESIGYKALARATSDLAAMGAAPRYFMLTLALPANRSGKWLDGILRGMARAARKFGMVLIGGDTSQYPSVVMSLTVAGQVAQGRGLLRSGARPGDGIFVSGRLGAAQVGLELMLRKLNRQRRCKSLLKPQFFPEIQPALGQWLSKKGVASAAIDISDGLSTDLTHVCKASGVGARIWASNIPRMNVPKGLQRIGLDSLDLALHGGEDYQLLFTSPKSAACKLPRAFRGVILTEIGEIIRGRGVELVDAGRTRPLLPRGWDSFQPNRKH